MGLGKLSFTALKGVFSKPATRRYPFEVRPPIAKSRGRIHFEEGKCTFCSLCELKCPPDAIKVDRQGRIFAIDHLLCILCGACVEACQKGSLSMDEKHGEAWTEKKNLSWHTEAPPKPAPPAGEGAPKA